MTRAPYKTFLNRIDGECHEQRRHEEDERRERGKLNAEDFVDDGRSGRRMQAVDQVSRDERSKEHAVRSEKRPHEEFLVGNAGRRGDVVVVIDGCGVAAHLRYKW